MVYKTTYLGGGNAVDEGDLLEAGVWDGNGHLPPVVNFLVVNLDGVADLVLLALEAQLNIVLEPFHL